MLSARKLVVVSVAVLLFAGVGFVVWDFLQLGRKIPEPVSAESQADLIRVDKTARTLTLLRGSNIIKTYRVSLGSTPDGHKSRSGKMRFISSGLAWSVV